MMVELGTRCATERAQVGNSPPKVARAWALLDPPHNDAFLTWRTPCASLQSPNSSGVIIITRILSNQLDAIGNSVYPWSP